MELRAVLVLFGSVLAVVFGQQQCSDQRKCMPFNDCPEYQSYVGVPAKTWPRHVHNEVKGLYCGMEQGTTGRIYKLCCKPKPGIRRDELNALPPGGKSGRDLLDLKICGRQSTQRIAHGKIAEVFQYPWMALLGGINGDFHCGGSLIAESFVLTAAHCNQFRSRVFFVRVGETDLSTEIDCNHAQSEEDCAEKYQDISVAQFIKHKLYSTSQKKNDIALVKLSKPAQMNDNVKPICLPLPEMLRRKIPPKMVVSGWGFTEDRNATSNQLRFANIPIVEQNQCQQSIRQIHDVYTVDESQVCAGGGSDGADNCEGDSGGPLQYFGNKAYVIHGVVSWGLASCGKESAPGVYTKVSHYLDWIIENLK
ncbi:CLIP domain-containing serine protease HP8-like [Ochlerotatus camptorhynchus]|uniref:CLIP domain-containing serine protease HP8-like n=1 Tax=Ochlerotatus camptorhynchus TaxID=644619 RepID=UPI0031D974D0